MIVKVSVSSPSGTVAGVADAPGEEEARGIAVPIGVMGIVEGPGEYVAHGTTVNPGDVAGVDSGGTVGILAKAVAVGFGVAVAAGVGVA